MITILGARAEVNRFVVPGAPAHGTATGLIKFPFLQFA